MEDIEQRELPAARAGLTEVRRVRDVWQAGARELADRDPEVARLAAARQRAAAARQRAAEAREAALEPPGPPALRAAGAVAAGGGPGAAPQVIRLGALEVVEAVVDPARHAQGPIQTALAGD
jgi:hypothetical protein